MKKFILSTAFLLSAAACANEEQTLKPGEVFKDCETCPEMVVIPAGEGMVGLHPKAVRKRGMPWRMITITAPFAVARFEVLQEEYYQCVEEGQCAPATTGFHDGLRRNPAHDLSWNDAKLYVDWLSKKTGELYRLLSENEWEYAARAGSDEMYWWGDEFRYGMDVCDGCSRSKQYISPVPADISLFQANPFGLYFMLGNVSEWVADCLDEVSKTNFSNTSAPVLSKGVCKFRLFKGGNFRTAPSFIHPSEGLGLDGASKKSKNGAQGLRVARDLK